jgi:hypothetical protein
VLPRGRTSRGEAGNADTTGSLCVQGSGLYVRGELGKTRCAPVYYASVQGERPGQSSLYDDFMKAFLPPYAGALSSATEVQKVVATISTIVTEFRRSQSIIEGNWPYPPSTATDP